MILHEKTLTEFSYTFENVGVWNDIWCQCDYCGCEFIRNKRNILLGTKITNKLSCKNKECNKKKIEESNLTKYGVSNYGGSTESLEKARVTTRERFGVDNANCCDEIKDKIAKTCLEKYGHKSYLTSPQCKQKLSEYCTEHGVDYVSQIPEVKEKIKETCLEKYGVDTYLKSEEMKEKTKEACLEKYGVDNYFKTPECRQKLSEYCAENGVEYVMQIQENKIKAKNTWLENYGVDHPLKSEEVKNKIKETNQERYGCSYPIQNKEIKEKISKTCLEKYGYKSYLETESCKKDLEKWSLENYGVTNIFHLPQNSNYGKKQKEIEDFLSSNNLSFSSNRNILKGREIDLYNDNLKLGIEFCGLYWHNELSPQPRNKWYHYKKYLDCMESGVRLITIFEDEWDNRQEQCKNIILSATGTFQQRMHARKCRVEPVSKEFFRMHCDKHHLLGNNKLVLQGWLLIDDSNQVIGGLSLGRHHRQIDKIVLDRMFFVPGIQVVGGASKLLSACIDWAKKNNYNQIISWSDNRWSSGNVYQKIGFILEEDMPPDYSYVNANRSNKRISKQSQQKKKTSCPEGLTEKEWATERGLARIWDCGKKRWKLVL